jgi:hypothetical protein
MQSKLIRVLSLVLGLALVQGLTGCGSDESVAAAPVPAKPVPADVATVGADLAAPSTARVRQPPIRLPPWPTWLNWRHLTPRPRWAPS